MRNGRTIQNGKRKRRSKSQCCLSGRCPGYARTRTEACHLLMHDLLPYMIRIFRTFSSIIWHIIFFFTNFCMRSFVILYFVLYDLLTIIFLRTSGILSFSLRIFAYDLLACDLLSFTIIFLRVFTYEHLAYDLFPYELLLTIFCRTIFCPMKTLAYEHLLTNLWHTIIRHTNICPVTSLELW